MKKAVALLLVAVFACAMLAGCSNNTEVDPILEEESPSPSPSASAPASPSPTPTVDPNAAGEGVPTPRVDEAVTVEVIDAGFDELAETSAYVVIGKLTKSLGEWNSVRETDGSASQDTFNMEKQYTLVVTEVLKGEDLKAQLGEPGEVDHGALSGSHIDLEVTGMDDHTGRAVDGQGHRVGNRVVHMDQFHIHASQLDMGPCRSYLKLCRTVQIVLFQLAFDQADGQSRAVNRHIQFFQQIRHRADMVLVAVGDHHAPDFFPVFLYERKIRNNAVYAGHIVIRERKAAVHDDHIVLALIQREVLADLV